MFDIGEEESHFLKQFYLGAMLGGLEWRQNRATRISRSTKLGVLIYLSILLVGKNFGRALLCRFVLVKHFRSNLA
jgi:hypothetical protein